MENPWKLDLITFDVYTHNVVKAVIGNIVPSTLILINDNFQEDMTGQPTIPKSDKYTYNM